MTETMRVKIRTTDQQWTAQHAERTEDEAAVVSIPTSAIERLTFAGRDMIRFDLRVVGKRLPRDWMNPHTMLPTSYVVA
jgi:hypothetical protein